jgi:predicted  nucleic acid-binding Zn-ribbon protein
MDLLSAGIGGAVATAVFTVLGWITKRSIAQLDRKIEAHDEALQKRADELAAFKLHVAESYVTGNELSKAIDTFNRSIDAVFVKLDRIEEKLDKKADK